MLENITNSNRKRNKGKEGYDNLPKQISHTNQVNKKIKDDFKNDKGLKSGKNNDTVIIKAIPNESIKQRHDS